MGYKQRFKLIALLTALFFLTGCATVIGKGSQEVKVTSIPENVAVTVDGENYYTTPVILVLRSKKSHTLLFAKEGYEPKKAVLVSSTSGPIAGNMLASTLIGWGLDGWTGAQPNLSPGEVHVVLEEIMPPREIEEIDEEIIEEAPAKIPEEISQESIKKALESPDYESLVEDLESEKKP